MQYPNAVKAIMQIFPLLHLAWSGACGLTAACIIVARQYFLYAAS